MYSYCKLCESYNGIFHNNLQCLDGAAGLIRGISLSLDTSGRALFWSSQNQKSPCPLAVLGQLLAFMVLSARRSLVREAMPRRSQKHELVLTVQDAKYLCQPGNFNFPPIANPWLLWTCLQPSGSLICFFVTASGYLRLYAYTVL